MRRITNQSPNSWNDPGRGIPSPIPQNSNFINNAPNFVFATRRLLPTNGRLIPVFSVLFFLIVVSVILPIYGFTGRNMTVLVDGQPGIGYRVFRRQLNGQLLIVEPGVGGQKYLLYGTDGPPTSQSANAAPVTFGVYSAFGGNLYLTLTANPDQITMTDEDSSPLGLTVSGNSMTFQDASGHQIQISL